MLLRCLKHNHWPIEENVTAFGGYLKSFPDIFMSRHEVFSQFPKFLDWRR
jgi:hypothetical protein